MKILGTSQKEYEYLYCTTSNVNYGTRFRWDFILFHRHLPYLRIQIFEIDFSLSNNAFQWGDISTEYTSIVLKMYQTDKNEVVQFFKCTSAG